MQGIDMTPTGIENRRDRDAIKMKAEANISPESTIPENVRSLLSTPRGTRLFFTPKLAAALDCAKATGRNAISILTAAEEGFAECYGVDISDLILNRTSL